MIKLKVEVFELQLRQESARQSNSRGNNTNRHSDSFWMAKLLESSSGVESKQSTSHLNRSSGMCRDTVITSTSTKRTSARKLAIDYDNQRKAVQEIIPVPLKKV
jgi:hypothetical protein